MLREYTDGCALLKGVIMKIRCSKCKEWYYEYREKVAIADNGGICNRCMIEHLKNEVKGCECEIVKLEKRLADINEMSDCDLTYESIGTKKITETKKSNEDKLTAIQILLEEVQRNFEEQQINLEKHCNALIIIADCMNRIKAVMEN